MKLFQRNKHIYEDRTTDYQFFIIKNITLLHLIYENDNPCPYTGIRILTSFLQPDCLFGVELQVKGYSWSFWLLSNYWEDLK